MGLSLKLILEQCGFKPSLRLRSDEQAAIDASQKLSGTRMRHLTLHQNFVRQLVRGKHAAITKIATKNNVADLMTKHNDAKTLERLVPLTGWQPYAAKHTLVKLNRINTIDMLISSSALLKDHCRKQHQRQIELGKELAGHPEEACEKSGNPAGK